MDGLTGTIVRPVLASAGMDRSKYARLDEVESSYSALPAPQNGWVAKGRLLFDLLYSESLSVSADICSSVFISTTQ